MNFLEVAKSYIKGRTLKYYNVLRFVEEDESKRLVSNVNFAFKPLINSFDELYEKSAVIIDLEFSEKTMTFILDNNELLKILITENFELL